MFFNNFLPSSMGGDVVKGYGLYTHLKKGKETAASVFLERYVGLAALVAILVISTPLGYPTLKDEMIVLLTVEISLAFGLLTAVVANRHTENLTMVICKKNWSHQDPGNS